MLTVAEMKDSRDMETLALRACGLTDDDMLDWDFKTRDAEIIVREEFGITLKEFELVAEALIKLTPRIRNDNFGTLHNAFVLYRTNPFSPEFIISRPVK